MVDDVVVVGEDAVGERVVAHELPDVLDGVQFGRVGRQEEQRDILRDDELGRGVPAGAVQNEDGMGAGIDCRRDLGQMLVHRAGVAVGQHEARALALLWTDRPEDVGPHRALVLGCRRPRAATGPAPGDLILLPYASFVGPPELDLCSLREFGLDGCQFGGKVFLKAATANSFWA